MVCWQLILEYLGPNLQHIYGVENVVADMLSIFPFETINRYKHSTTRAISQMNELLVTIVEKKFDDIYPLHLVSVHQ